MNASTQSAVIARNRQHAVSRTPRIVAAIAAIVVTIVLFDGVALLLGGRDDVRPGTLDGTVVAESVGQSAAR